MTRTQTKIIAAIENGHTDLRAICAATGLASASNVSYHLRQLAAAGHVALKDGPHGLTVADGADFCAGWDMAARLAGNPDA